MLKSRNTRGLGSRENSSKELGPHNNGTEHSNKQFLLPEVGERTANLFSSLTPNRQVVAADNENNQDD